MLNIISFLNRAIGRPAPTVASIMSGFTKAIDQLDTLSAECAAASDAKATEIVNLMADQDNLCREASLAITAANKLRALVG